MTLPGGHAEPDEDMEACARRELLEEAGLEPKHGDLELIGHAVIVRPSGKGSVHVYAYRCQVDGEPDSSNDPDEEVCNWGWIDIADGIPDHIMDNLHSPRNVTLQALGLQTLRGEEEILDKGEALETFDLAKMALADLQPGIKMPSGRWDYSHLLPEQHRKDYRLVVEDKPHPEGHQSLAAILIHRHKGNVGSARGSYDLQPGEGGKRAVRLNIATIIPHIRGQGFGPAIYEAFLSHAMSKGATHAVGDEHSSNASSVHRKLAAKHGLMYEPKPNNPEDAKAGQQLAATTGEDNGAWDFAYGPYEYALKSEDLVKMAMADIPDGKPSGEEWDYSHLLPPGTGLSIRVRNESARSLDTGELYPGINARLYDGERCVGSVSGILRDIQTKKGNVRGFEPHSEIHRDYRNKGFGKALYSAAFKHVHRHHGVTLIYGNEHTDAAGRVHDSLAAEHGFDYAPGVDGMGRGPYQYALKVEELLAKAEQLRKAADTPEFRQWFAGSKLVDENGKPLVFYRGVRRPDLKGYLPLQSFTDSPDVASIYAARPPSDYADEKYIEGSSVFPVHLRMQNPMELKGHSMHFDDVLRALQYGKPNGITHEEAVKMLNYMINRKAGKVKAGDFSHTVYDHDGEDEMEADFGDLLRGRTTLHDFRDDFKHSEDDHEDDIMETAARLKADTFVYVDSPRFKEVAKRLGHDGVVHDDVFDGAASAAPKLLGKEPHELHGVKRGGWGAKFTHKTYRPFDDHQIVSTYDEKPHHPAEAAAEAPPAPALVKAEASADAEKAPRYLYHVTYHNRLPSIAHVGLQPNSPRSIGAPAMDAHARGKLFFSDAEGTKFWHSRAERFAEHNSDNLSSDHAETWNDHTWGHVPVVLRVAEHHLGDTEVDDHGSRDSLAEAVTTTQPVQPRHIEVFNGHDWVPVEDEYRNPSMHHMDALRTENEGHDEYGEEQILHYFKDQSPFYPQEHHFSHVPAAPLPKWQDGSHYPKAGASVDGFLVGDKIPNMGSIGATLNRYTSLGVRELPFEDFADPKDIFYAADDHNRAAELAEKIKASGRIDPLIVVHDKEGPYILEGVHRFAALHRLGAKTFPALVVRDDDSHDALEKFSQDLDFWYGDRLEKMAISPHDTLSVGRMHTDKGEDFVDVTPDLTGGHEESRKAFHEHVLSKPEVVPRTAARQAGTSNASAKSIWKTPNGTFMAKAYHEKPAARTGLVKFPIQGWAEMTNQALYHAGGIGDLHQQVHVAQIPLGRKTKRPMTEAEAATARSYGLPQGKITNFDGGDAPALVVRFAPGAEQAVQGRHGLVHELKAKPHIADQARRIALMDFLTGNLDRHAGNLMYVPSRDGLLAVDHSRSFQYAQPRKFPNRHRPNEASLYDHATSGALEPFVQFPTRIAGGQYDRWLQTHDEWRPTFDWWAANRDKIAATFNERLKSIKNDVVREHLRNHFEQRHRLLSQMADFGTENFGADTWAHTPVEMDPAPKLAAKLLRAELAHPGAMGYPLVMEEDMTKGLKHKLWNLAAATALAVTPVALGGNAPQPQSAADDFQGPPPNPAAPPIGGEPMKARPWTPHGLPTEMHPIAHLESNFGRNVAHAAHSKGDFHTAFGAVGFKPVTAHFEYKKSPAIQKLYPGLHDEQKFLEAFKADPQLYNMLAGKHFSWLKGALGGDPVRAAYGWRWGIGAAQNASADDVANDGYVRQYQVLAARKPADVRRAIDANLKKSEQDAEYAPARAKIVPWLAARGIKDAVDPEEVPHGLGETLATMLGGHSDELRQAAQILSGRRDPIVEVEHGEDPVEDVMRAYGIEPTEENRRALAALVSEFMQKSEVVGIQPTSVQPVFPEGRHCAEGIQNAYLQELVYEVKLGGKHSKGVMLALDNRDPTLPVYWLLKPGSGRLSPAAGIRELAISQTRREAGFAHVARQLLPNDVPETHIVLINDQEVAAIRVLTKGFVAAQRVKEDAAKVFGEAKHDGRLFMWAALDYVLGNVDRHGGNILLGPDGSPKLIDHGSSLAGHSFSPGTDPATYVPYYLRSWIGDWKQLDTAGRRAKLPAAGPEQEAILQAFLEKLGVELRQLHRYAPPALEPCMERLNWLRGQHVASKALLDAWMGLAGPSVGV